MATGCTRETTEVSIGCADYIGIPPPDSVYFMQVMHDIDMHGKPNGWCLWCWDNYPASSKRKLITRSIVESQKSKPQRVLGYAHIISALRELRDAGFEVSILDDGISTVKKSKTSQTLTRFSGIEIN